LRRRIADVVSQVADLIDELLDARVSSSTLPSVIDFTRDRSDRNPLRAVGAIEGFGKNTPRAGFSRSTRSDE